MECYVKALDPEGLMTRSGQLCQRCGASLDQKGKSLTSAGELICLDCVGKDLDADWDKRKLPGAPENCERCGASLAGNDVAMLWLGQAICSGCFKKVRMEHPEITQFGLIPLVELKWPGLSGAGADLMLDVTPVGANDREDVDWEPDGPDGHIH
jgi:ribosomal protein S27AE